jgi:hypothetical protein
MPKADEPSRRAPTMKSTRFPFFGLMFGVLLLASQMLGAGVLERTFKDLWTTVSAFGSVCRSKGIGR